MTESKERASSSVWLVKRGEASEWANAHLSIILSFYHWERKEKKTISQRIFCFARLFIRRSASCVSYIFLSILFYFFGALSLRRVFCIAYFFSLATCFTEIPAGIYCITFMRLNSFSLCVLWLFLLSYTNVLLTNGVFRKMNKDKQERVLVRNVRGCAFGTTADREKNK